MPLISKHELKQQFPLWYQITAMIACSANVPQVVETFSGPKTVEDIGTRYFETFEAAKELIVSENRQQSQKVVAAIDELRRLSKNPLYTVDRAKSLGFGVRPATRQEWLLDRLGFKTGWRRKLNVRMEDAHEHRRIFSESVALIELPKEINIPGLLPLGTKVWYSVKDNSSEEGGNIRAQEVEIARIELPDNRILQKQGDYDFVPRYILSVTTPSLHFR